MNKSHTLAELTEAIKAIAQVAVPLNVVEMAIESACDLVLARPVIADMNHPPFARSIMDGFAVRSADCAFGGATLQVVGEVPAGQWPVLSVGPGEAIGISTGAPIPPAADAVVPIEDTELSADHAQINLTAAVTPGAYIAAEGTNVRAGETVLPAGVRLRPAQIAAAAAGGAATVSVYRRPKLAILSTGDELVGHHQLPQRAQIRDANSPMLAAQARQAGCEVIELGRVPDQEPRIAEAVRRGLEADVLCISGGVSVGQHDLVPSILASHGVRFVVQKVAIKPGKPSLVGVGPEGQMVFGLPGNPVSSFVCFQLFVRAALAGLQGQPVGLPAMIAATLAVAMGPAGNRSEFLPALLKATGSARYQIEPVAWQGSGDPFGLARANCLLVREAHEPARAAGDTVHGLPIADLPLV